MRTDVLFSFVTQLHPTIASDTQTFIYIYTMEAPVFYSRSYHTKKSYFIYLHECTTCIRTKLPNAERLIIQVTGITLGRRQLYYLSV